VFSGLLSSCGTSLLLSVGPQAPTSDKARMGAPNLNIHFFLTVLPSFIVSLTSMDKVMHEVMVYKSHRMKMRCPLYQIIILMQVYKMVFDLVNVMLAETTVEQGPIIHENGQYIGITNIH